MAIPRLRSLVALLSVWAGACGLLYDVESLEEKPSNAGIDANAATCGAPGQPCCGVDLCDDFAKCLDLPDAAPFDSGEDGAGGPVCVECGGENEPCCDNIECNSTDLKCVGDVCKSCGEEGEDCCAIPGECQGNLSCDPNGKCNKCAQPAVACGDQPYQICDSALACVSCGGLDATLSPCCAGQQCTSDISTCCDKASPGDQCLACGSMPNCTCKLCCYRCKGWQNPKSLKAPAGQCDAMAKNLCPAGDLVASYFTAGACNP